MEDFIGNGSKVAIGGKEYDLDFSMASFYYLSEKYGDIGKLFGKIKKGIDAESIGLVSDMLYAGMLKYNEVADDFVSPLKAKQIMAMLHISDLANATDAVTRAFTGSVPVAKADPTMAGENPAK